MDDLRRPDQTVDSIVQINWNELRENNKTNVLIDVDHTLLAWGPFFWRVCPTFKQKIYEAQKMGFKFCIISNCGIFIFIPRVIYIAKSINAKWHACCLPVIKPNRKAFNAAMSKIGGSPKEFVMIGNSIRHDIVGGNKSGLYTILVKSHKPKHQKLP